MAWQPWPLPYSKSVSFADQLPSHTAHQRRHGHLWNTVEFRKGADLENQLEFAGLVMHQMQPQLAFESHYFRRPLKRASFWPDHHHEWLRHDQEWRADQLPQPDER